MNHERWLRPTHAYCLSCRALIPRKLIRAECCNICIVKRESYTTIFPYYGTPSFLIRIPLDCYETWGDFLYFPDLDMPQEIKQALTTKEGIELANRMSKMPRIEDDSLPELKLDSWEIIQLCWYFENRLEDLNRSIRSGAGTGKQRDHVFSADLGL